MEHGFYHPTVGYWQTVSEPSAEILVAYPPGTAEVPLMPGPGYTFSGSQWAAPTQSWLDNTAAKSVRSERLRRLVREVDPITANALRWASLVPEQQLAWAVYRTALLDITGQSGFPHNIMWPTKPE